MKVGEDYLNKNHHFFFDSFFTSVPLANELLEKKTYSCGTFRTYRKGWPKDLLFSKKMKADKTKTGEVRRRQRGSMMATAWQDKRLVNILSTNVQPEMGSALRQRGRGKEAFLLVILFLFH